MSVDLEKRSFVKNLCPWDVSFKLHNSKGEVYLEAGKKVSINNGELVTLVENGDVMFVGTGDGNHARVYIENDDLRKYVGFESEDSKIKQFVLTDEECQRILEYKTFSTFKKHVEEEIVANHEKHKIMDFARKAKLNDFDKVSFLVEYCGIPFKTENN